MRNAPLMLLSCGLFCSLAVFVLPGSGAVAQAAQQTGPSTPLPRWIWISPEGRSNEVAYFRKTFQAPDEVKSAVLVASCDNRVSLTFNGQQLVEHDQWQRPVRIEITERLRPGKNVLAARCANDDGPAALLVQVSLELADGTRQAIVTDDSWLAAADPKDGWDKIRYDDSPWAKVHSFGEWGIKPWGRITIDGPVPPAMATNPEEITVPKGFVVELLYSVPLGEQGSWVSMTPDAKGRLIVSDQYGALYRVTPGGDIDSTHVEKLDVPLGEAQGLLWAYDSLYVMVNGKAGQGSGLYRLRDNTGDEQFDEVQLLKKLDGGGEHGPHGIRLGPDGLLYVVAGNHTNIPDELVPESPHRNWAEDLLLKRNPDGRGHATGRMAPGGWIARTDQDGKRWELVCAGFRNPYDHDFNLDGELFTYDADMEWDTGAPWYRPTRVNHATSGAEFGWRYGTGKWPAYFCDSVGAVVDIGMGSPTGISFGTGARFPARYQRALYINDWTYGKMYAVHMEPRGASYTGHFETFVQGKPLPLTDVVINRDGALYFTIGGRQTQSGLYRVRYTGEEPTDAAAPLENPAAEAARALRRKLESFHGRQDPQALNLAWKHLNSADRHIRYAARVAVEHQPLDTWQERALGEPRLNASIAAMLALTRVGGKDVQQRVIDRLGQLPLGRLTEEQLLDTLRVYALAFIRLGGKNAAAVSAAIASLDPLYPHPGDLVNRELCRVLVYLEAPRVIERTMKLLETAQTQQDQMFYVFVLRNLQSGWTPEQRTAYFGWLNIAESKYHGGASFQHFVQQIRDDAVATLSPVEKQALAEVIEGRRQVNVVRLETARQFIHNWQVEDLIPLLDQVATERSFEKGKAAFHAAQCAKCHRFADEGGDTGPDITGVGNRFDARYLLEALVLPSKVVSDQYVNSIIQTADGEVLTGRIIDEDEKRLTIRTDPFARELTPVAKDNIELREVSSISEMPEGLINVLSKEEVLDLVAYLRSGGNPNDKAFGKTSTGGQ